MRFDVSPMVEVVQSGRMLNSGRWRPPYREWYAEARARVRALDTQLLALLLPDRPFIADFLVARPGHASTIDEHLRAIAEYPADRLRDDLLVVWPDRRPPRLVELLADPVGASRRIADLLHGYWTLLIEPHWRRIHAVLRDDVAYRATRLASDGVDGMLADLHQELSVADGTLLIDKPRHKGALTANGRFQVDKIVISGGRLSLRRTEPTASKITGVVQLLRSGFWCCVGRCRAGSGRRWCRPASSAR
ncbi:hypothetical protein [Actinophytocola sp.]|uniref:hypothetical protein n=1 Tax=Actinophytocola sp. TaxID=1872138 RepID=UPI0025BBF5B4|nr:hypothetical protein [Actinophytocola sp.]